MGQELLYTSAPRGLKPGSRGFCTVLSTRGMPAPLATAVEALSGYRPVFLANNNYASLNPIVYSHLKLQATGRSWHVLSRIADYGLDYSQRANKLAHHVILDNLSEQLPGGPANLLSMSGFMRTEWSGDPKVVDLKPIRLEPEVASGICRHWEQMTGDAGWAGVLAESFLNDPERLVILLFKPGQQVLPLFAEAIALLPPEERWNVTFSTYFTGLVTGTTCQWRAILHDSKEANESLRFVTAIRIDLTQSTISRAAGGDLVTAARTGDGPPTGTAITLSGFPHPRLEADEAQRLVPRRATSINSLHSRVHNRTEPPDLVAQLRGLVRARRRWIKWPFTWVIGLPVGCLIAFVFWSAMQKADFQPHVRTDTKVPDDTPQRAAEADLNTVESTPIQSPKQQIKAQHQDHTPPAPLHLPVLPRPEIQATSQTPVLLNLPTNDRPAVLLDFEKEPQFGTLTPEVRLLIPQWLSSTYVAQKSKQAVSETSDVLWNISVPAIENVVVARIEEIRGSSRYFKFKALHDDRLSIFSWCRLRVVDSANPPEVLKEIKFIDFPVNIPSIERHIGIVQPTKWRLPKAIIVDAANRPSFDLKYFSIACYAQNYKLTPHTNGALSWSMPCAEINSALREICAGSNDHQSSVPRLSVVLEIRLSDSPSVQITAEGYAESIEVVEKNLEQQCRDLKAELTSKSFKNIPEDISITSYKHIRLNLLHSIDSSGNEELKKEELELLRNRVDVLHNRIDTFEMLRLSLNNIKVTACRVSYTLYDTISTLPSDVEVIDINQNPEANQNTLRGPQP